ncbi:MAG: hypothetical protein ACOYBP_04245 [Microbacteriaceae bacterium]
MTQSSSNRPLPAYVYRRRRLAVFGGLGLILILVLLLWHPWSGSANGKQGNTPAVIPATSAPAATSGETNTSTDTAQACTKSQVKVSAMTDSDSYAAGQYPQLTVSVENTGDSACSLNVGTSQQVFTITSGSEIYWLSTDCQNEASDYQLVLQPKTPVTSEPIQWDRTRSNPGTCTLTTRDPVPAEGATYHLTASIDGIPSSSSANFTLN